MGYSGGSSDNDQDAPLPTKKKSSAAAQEPAAETPDETFSRIYREQWNDWEERFKPYQDYAFDTVLDPEERARLDQEALDNSQTAVDTAFTRTQERIQTMASRLPQADEDPQMAEARNRQLSLAQRSTKNDAYNKTQQALADREMERIAG